MIKISSATQKELICLCGLCDHDYTNAKCPYYKMVDKRNPDEEMLKRILFLMKKEIQSNVNKEKKKTNGTKKQNKSK